MNNKTGSILTCKLEKNLNKKQDKKYLEAVLMVLKGKESVHIFAAGL